MTAIAAIRSKNGTIWMGGDSAGVAGLRLNIRKDPKVFVKANKFIMGFTSSFRMGQLLRFKFIPPFQRKEQDIEEYLHTTFIDKIRKCFKDGGYTSVHDGKEQGGCFLVGYKGVLFYIHSDFQIGFPAHSYSAVGCGDELCLGSLHATENMGLKPHQRLTMALEAAESFSAGVRGPFLIKSVKG